MRGLPLPRGPPPGGSTSHEVREADQSLSSIPAPPPRPCCDRTRRSCARHEPPAHGDYCLLQQMIFDRFKAQEVRLIRGAPVTACAPRLSAWGPSLMFLVVWVRRAATLRCRVSYEVLTLPPPVESLPLRTEGQAGGFSSGTLGRQPAVPLLVRPPAGSPLSSFSLPLCSLLSAASGSYTDHVFKQLG